MSHHQQPPDLVLAILTIETWPPEEKPYPYPRRQSTPPKPEPTRSHKIYLVNRGETPLDVQFETGGSVSEDDRLVETSVSSYRRRIAGQLAALVESPDDGAFDFNFYYDVRVTVAGSAATWHGEFGISRWGSAPLDTFEDDPVLGHRVRVVRPGVWRRVIG